MTGAKPERRRGNVVFQLALGGYVLAGGAATLVGWLAGVPALVDWEGDGIAMKANAAVAMTAVGTALLLLARPSAGSPVRFLALVVLAIGGLTGLEHLFGWDLGIDTLVADEPAGARATAAPGRMGPPASSACVLLGIGLLLAARGRDAPAPRRRRWASRAGTAVAAIASLSLVGYAIGADPLFDVARLTAISLQMATLVFAAGCALVAAVGEHGTAAILASRGPGGVLARRLVPVALALPALEAALGLLLIRSGAADASFTIAILTIVAALATCAVVLSAARALDAADAAKREARAREDAERERIAAERERLHERERHARETLQAAVRAKDDFLATLSHELRTPLNSIIGWTYLAKQDRAQVERALEVVDRNARAQAALVEDLLDVSRISLGRMRLNLRSVDVRDVVDAVVETARPEAGARGVELAGEPGVPAIVRADVERLRQVVANLVANAVKFTESGGRVTLRVETEGPVARIVVRDTGRGIRAEFLPHVFERFRQDDSSPSREHGGLGIGLALVKELVELHRGSVRAESDGPGKGSTFTVELPLSTDAGDAVPVASYSSSM